MLAHHFFGFEQALMFLTRMGGGGGGGGRLVGWL